MKKYFIGCVVFVLLSMVLTSCGGGGATKIDVTLDDHSFSPDEVSIAAGEEITITVTNKGTEEHEWVIFNKGKDAGEAFGDEDEGNIYWEIEALPGESKTETFTAPAEAGEYYITCGIEDHLEQGMVGKVMVVK
jgi:plastocyanin